MLPALSWAQEASPVGSRFTSPGLAPGDQIDVHLYDFPELGGIVHAHVSADGSIRLPYAGAVRAEGLSPEQLQVAIADALKSKGIAKDPNVTLDVVSAVNLIIQVLGEVKAPRSIPAYAPLPISYVLAQVGGTTGLASRQLTILHHSEEPPTSVDYDPDNPTANAMNALVLPGDIVTVSHLGVFFVAGEVNRPGIFPLGGILTQGGSSGVVAKMTLLQALAQAGGITPIAARSKMRILRTTEGKREEIVVDLVKLYKGEIADPILHPNDIIYIPSSYIRQQTNNLFSTAVASLYAATQLRQF